MIKILTKGKLISQRQQCINCGTEFEFDYGDTRLECIVCGKEYRCIICPVCNERLTLNPDLKWFEEEK